MGQVNTQNNNRHRIDDGRSREQPICADATAVGERKDNRDVLLKSE